MWLNSVWLHSCLTGCDWLTVGWTGAYDELVKKRPSSSLVTAANIASLLIHVALVIFVQAIVFVVLQSQPWLVFIFRITVLLSVHDADTVMQGVANVIDWSYWCLVVMHCCAVQCNRPRECLYIKWFDIGRYFCCHLGSARAVHRLRQITLASFSCGNLYLNYVLTLHARSIWLFFMRCLTNFECDPLLVLLLPVRQVLRCISPPHCECLM